MVGGHVLLRTGSVFRYTSATGFLVVLTGTGFAYDGKSVPTGGTITSMEIYHNGIHYASYTGLDYLLTDFALHGLGLASGVATVAPTDSTALYTGLRSGSDEIHGSEIGRDMSSYAGNDTIFGNGGDDWLNGGKGVDRFYGGAGIDGVYFSDVGVGGHGVRVDMALSVGNILNDGYGNVETATSVEKYDGSKFADLLSGSSLGDTLAGEAGNDTVSGARGNDALYGDAGSDSVYGGNGNDTVEGGNGLDKLDGGRGVNMLAFWDVVVPGHVVTVNLGLATHQVIDDGFGFSETVLNFRDIAGSDLADSLTGNGQANTFWGNAGADHLIGGKGNDSLYGGDGNDTIVGGAGDDEVGGDKGRDSFFGGWGQNHLGFWDVDATGHGVAVNLALSTRNILDDGYGNVETAVNFQTVSGSSYGDSITGTVFDETLWGNDGNDTLTGAGGKDSLIGGYGDDFLDGGDGDDVLRSFEGNDTMTGGAGNDTFVFADDVPAVAGRDVILDMTHGQDSIGIATWWTTALTGQNRLTAAQFLSQAGANQAQTIDQHVIYDPTTGSLYFDVDGNGSAYATVLIAILSNHPSLTYQDFILTD